ncbi:MAG: signal recognition particle-docking protein FtsY [Spirochaetota bacterium]|jgi:fused signal recognition particle receptor|nr:signal recognition particle-docking protein FtsY [Spirochaetota bacterium]
MSLQEKYRLGLEKTRAGLGSRLTYLFRSRKSEKELYAELEEILIAADAGVSTTKLMINAFREYTQNKKINDATEELFISFLEELLSRAAPPQLPQDIFKVILFLGVNGSGKTTTIGKLAKTFSRENERVIIAAADTFRAAAAEQLAEWAGRANVPLVRQQQGADPGAVVFDALASARARSASLLLVDTAGRFHNRETLVRELQKIDKIIKGKSGAEDRYYRMIVLDATAGTNAFAQAKSFHEAVPLDAVILTKMDSSAKGGVVLPLVIELGLPIFRLGVGEGIDDLIPFEAAAYARALF